MFKEVAKFLAVKNKALDKRLICRLLPCHPIEASAMFVDVLQLLVGAIIATNLVNFFKQKNILQKKLFFCSKKNRAAAEWAVALCEIIAGGLIIQLCRRYQAR
jgi:hypothetical protein